MRLLVLGGTVFLGRAAVEESLRRGHEVTLFNRGSDPGLFPQVERLRGDRSTGLSPLAGRRFDAVLDTSGYVPRDVRAAAEALRESGRYAFVSSVSVYADFSGRPREDDAVRELGDAPADEVAEDSSNYGALKALCEREAQDVFGERALVVRPGLIAGPHDPTGRFTYWARRLARGGEVLAPGPPERRFQFVDVRDLAAWILDCLERGRGGVFNATNEGVPLDELLEGADVKWVDDTFLQAQGVGQWLELPFWVHDPQWRGMHDVDVSRALAEGLRFRPIAETLAGAATAPVVEGVGLTAEREAELLEAWHARA